MTETDTVTEEVANHRRAWRDALRSGDYRQGTNQLRPETGRFCCLGVACDIMSGTWSRPAGDWMFDGFLSMMPTRGLHWYGLTPTQAESLATLNDGGGSFAEIVAVMEAWFGDDLDRDWRETEPEAAW